MFHSQPIEQIFSTTIHLVHELIDRAEGYTAVDYTFVSIPGEFSTERTAIQRPIATQLTELSYFDYAESEGAVFKVINSLVNEQLGEESSRFQELSLILFSSVEIPVRNSPVRGVTLGSMLSSGSLTGLVALGKIDVEQAGIAVLFGAGTIIIFGAAKGVANALERGLDRRLSRALSVKKNPRRSRTKPEQAEDRVRA